VKHRVTQRSPPPPQPFIQARVSLSCLQHPDPRNHLEPPESNLHHLNRSFRSFIAVNLNLFSHMLSSGFIIRNAWRASVNKGSVGAWLDILSTDNTQLREPTLLLVDIRGWGGTGLRVSNPEGTFDGIGWSLRVCALLTVDLVGLSRVVDASRAEFVSPLCVYFTYTTWCCCRCWKPRIFNIQASYSHGDKASQTPAVRGVKQRVIL